MAEPEWLLLSRETSAACGGKVLLQLIERSGLAAALERMFEFELLVEVVFTYPGIGTVLFRAIRGSDYYLVQGIVFILIVSIGVAMVLFSLT